MAVEGGGGIAVLANRGITLDIFRAAIADAGVLDGVAEVGKGLMSSSSRVVMEIPMFNCWIR